MAAFDMALLEGLQPGWNGPGSQPLHACLLRLCWGALHVLHDLGHESPNLYPYSDAEVPSCALDVVWPYRDVYCELSMPQANKRVSPLRTKGPTNSACFGPTQNKRLSLLHTAGCDEDCAIKAHMSWLHPGRHLLQRPRMYVIHSLHELATVWIAWLSNSEPQFSSSI
jgi:hypothetical protein